MLVLPGLKVKGMSKAQGRGSGLTIFTSADYIEKHVSAVFKAAQDIINRFDEVTRQNVHEVRGLNSGIYHASVELQELTRPPNGDRRLHDLATNVAALSQILSARVDYITFLANQTLVEADSKEVPVYKRFDKMARCFLAKAARSNVNITLYGESFGCTFGPSSLFEIIPYLLLDNAVKYSPPRQRIKVVFDESDRFVNVLVSSVGPRIRGNEVEAIFRPNYRGRHARGSGREGTGIGLSVLRSLVEEAFGGRIWVGLGEFIMDRADVPFDEVTFKVSFPKVGELRPTRLL